MRKTKPLTQNEIDEELRGLLRYLEMGRKPQSLAVHFRIKPTGFHDLSVYYVDMTMAG